MAKAKNVDLLFKDLKRKAVPAKKTAFDLLKNMAKSVPTFPYRYKQIDFGKIFNLSVNPSQSFVGLATFMFWFYLTAAPMLP